MSLLNITLILLIVLSNSVRSSNGFTILIFLRQSISANANPKNDICVI